MTVSGWSEQIADHPGVAVDHPRAELVARGVGDHPGVGFVTDPQAVLGHEADGEGVVGRDRGLEDILGVTLAGVGSIQCPGLCERHPDPVAQIGGRLGGEGQPEDLIRTHLAGEDEVDHASSHERRLARSGARDHDGRLERGRDRPPLLLARGVRGVHHPGELLGSLDPDRRHGRRAGHRLVTGPALLIGHSGTNEQVLQWAPEIAGKFSSRSSRAASRRRRCSSVRSGPSSACPSCGWTRASVAPSNSPSWTSSAPPEVADPVADRSGRSSRIWSTPPWSTAS